MSAAEARLLDAVREETGSTLRDVHLFTAEGHEMLYLRDDVAEQLTEVDLPKYIDNERYGFVTRDTYQDLHYARYRYTVRGFAEFEQFRCFLGDGHDLGVLISLDVGHDHDWTGLRAAIDEVVDEVGLDALRPPAEG